MTMKKFTALAAALALCCGLLAGCSSASVVTKDSSAASGSAASDSASAAEERAPGLYVDGQAVERAAEEIEADRAAIPAPAPTAQEQLRADVDFLAAMQGVAL